MRIGDDRRIETLGAHGSCLTLAWLATHRDRLRTLLFGGKRLSVLIVWDTKGAALVDHDDVEVEALARIVYGPRPSACPECGVREYPDHTYHSTGCSRWHP